ncbi:hypothetical protein ASPWEDRAFT_48016 [Aspergillus wentii DTO 134E9]|uniref:Ysc84 actin-binding domain-containing protein n=1 Tax=Aspergillus wentii DTO 134E9 TaxID=1073089 RepID=A0A1L9S2S2_ASPWE|nr:uncharacterized protein ASPWEDRAFT_48016 [Aspergillus wentii DTO 134E9]OJJ41436.1 hypothetical protein ASPWEDRAFT_48016 [Aspergillus wentii DTO 134E9]
MPSQSWEKTKGYSKKGFDKAWSAFDKLGAPVNRLSYRLGAEAFWPMELEKENEKAARILRSFCNDGFYANDDEPVKGSNGKIDRPKGKQRVIQKIPSKVIQRAKGIAIFTTMRTGLWLSGSGGSGVLMARIPETGEWSPPSGIMLHTAGVGFLAGVDIYDCVVVINTYEALEAFKKVRCTLGGEVSASAGPVGVGGVLESEIHKRQAPIWTYMKSRGLYAGVQVDGTIIIERTDENERFYGERIPVGDILAGKARNPPASIKGLIQTIKAAQGDKDADQSLIPSPGATPGDMELHPVTGLFGIPDPEDPDPYGVKALEAQGLMIREAGTNNTPAHESFQFRPSSGSPIFANFPRLSLESSPRTSWRASGQSYASVDRGTQTDGATAPTSISRASSRSNKISVGRTDPTPSLWDGDDNRWDSISLYGHGHDHDQDHVHAQDDVDADYESDKDSVDDVDLEVHEVSSATVSKRESFANISPVSVEGRQSPKFTRARVVNIPKRSSPPALPPRHPQRTHTSAPVSPITPSSPTDAASISSEESLPPKLIAHNVDGDEFYTMPSAHQSEFEDNTKKEVSSTTKTGDVPSEAKPAEHKIKVPLAGQTV